MNLFHHFILAGALAACSVSFQSTTNQSRVTSDDARVGKDAIVSDVRLATKIRLRRANVTIRQLLSQITDMTHVRLKPKDDDIGSSRLNTGLWDVPAKDALLAIAELYDLDWIGDAKKGFELVEHKDSLAVFLPADEKGWQVRNEGLQFMKEFDALPQQTKERLMSGKGGLTLGMLPQSMQDSAAGMLTAHNGERESSGRDIQDFGSTLTNANVFVTARQQGTHTFYGVALTSPGDGPAVSMGFNNIPAPRASRENGNERSKSIVNGTSTKTIHIPSKFYSLRGFLSWMETNENLNYVAASPIDLKKSARTSEKTVELYEAAKILTKLYEGSQWVVGEGDIMIVRSPIVAKNRKDGRAGLTSEQKGETIPKP